MRLSLSHDLDYGFDELILVDSSCFLFFLIDFFNIKLIDNVFFEFSKLKEEEEDHEAVEKANGLKLVSITSLCNDDS